MLQAVWSKADDTKRFAGNMTAAQHSRQENHKSNSTQCTRYQQVQSICLRADVADNNCTASVGFPSARD